MNVIYIRMAWLGIQKNRRFYLPYLLTCIGMVMMYYIVSFLSTSTTLLQVAGGDVMQTMLEFGQFIIGLFSLFFLFYTNSFLIRRRKKEFGLYNILGMGKRNLVFILFWENSMIALISMVVGLLAGIAFSKFAELGMINILKATVSFSITLDLKAIWQTIKIFAIIFCLLLFYSLYQIHLSNPIELLHSENVGEKPPKANWFLALFGFILLCIAYYLAITIERPVEALLWFFVAVALVMIATYLLFIAGSVTICRILQKNKKYYYKTNHFISISSMVYRMKRNGAGLASICVLCTMVLVILSSTFCLYIGAEDSLHTRYPRDINVDIYLDHMDQLESPEIEPVRQFMETFVTNYGETMEHTLDYRAITFSAYFENGNIELDSSSSYAYQMSAISNIWEVFFVSLEDYNHLTKEKEILNSDEALIYTTKLEYQGESFTILNNNIKIKKKLSDFAESGRGAMEILPSIYIIMPRDAIYERLKPLEKLKSDTDRNLLEFHWIYGFDLDASNEKQIQMQTYLEEGLKQLPQAGQNGIFSSFWCEGLAKERSGFYGLYGGLFFLGILLGIVFLFAAVLIMYYKQVSEGYEDQSRFEIMQKIGMTKKDIKKSVNSQVLTVFFLPLFASGMHLFFAFSMIYRLLVLFSLTNKTLLIFVTICCFLIFALFYIFVYRITSRAYYIIVSNQKRV